MHSYVWNGTASDRIHVSYVGGPLAYACPEHRHTGFAELTVVLRGRLEHHLDGHWQTQEIGAATLLRTGEAHALRGHAVEYLNLSFDLDFLRHTDPTIRTIFERSGSFTGRLGDGPLANVIRDAETLAGAPPARQALLLLRILTTVGEASLDQSDVTTPVGPAWLESLRARLADPAAAIPDLATLRRWAGVAPEHLARTMRTHHACTPVQWLHQHRLTRAARRLAATSEPISDIASAAGYADAPAFHRCFKRVYGLGPRDYRQREQRFVR